MPGKAIGIDIGGTKMAIGAVNNEGILLHRVVMPTEAGKGFSRTVKRLGDAITDIMSRGSSVGGIGKELASAVPAQWIPSGV